MTDKIEPASPKLFYEGRGLPVDSLSPSEFEDFVFGCLLCIQDVLGVQILSSPSGSGDGGFDVQGKVIASNRLVCVQCKRQKQPLGVAQAADELAKVAATAALENSDVGEHRLICTGGIRKNLRSQLREEPREKLANDAGERLATSTSDELNSLRKCLEQEGFNPRQVAKSYVLGLDNLTAWGLDEFDAALSPRWENVLIVVERYFQVATVVREFPRACFDRKAYIAEHIDFNAVVEPHLTNVELPDEISTTSAEDPSLKPEKSRRIIRSLNELGELNTGDLAILLGDGGVGKSTALKLLRSEALRANPDSTLPVLISMATYVPGSLTRAIHQELGVVHGTWQTLPDRILLLCDGLNECPSANVAAFLEELKFLLKRSLVTCVISSRESSKHRKVILPLQPVACVKVEEITPAAISKIAANELPGEQVNDFLEAYRALADGTWSPLLWTPFSAMVAIRLWKLNATLPKNLGEMLEELLQARCARDAESAELGPSPEGILSLAGAIAFQCLIIDRRLECPAKEAGKCIREAQKYCLEALGIADLTETQIVEILARHELLKVSERGSLCFGHQLLAGALAAPVLAREWQNHKDCLGEPVADDAWVFAARLVPKEQVKHILKETFQIDLLLGARTARELSGEFREYAEKLIGIAITEESPEIVRLQGLYALSSLGSRGAISKLKMLANQKESQVHYVACRALAASGDIDYLSQILPRVDRMLSSGIQMTGGEVGIWEAAPLPTRLDLARKRLSVCECGDMVGESLSLIAYERDPSDIPLVEKFLGENSSFPVLQRALFALHRISPLRATEFLENTLSKLSNPIDKAALMHTAERIGIVVDIRSAFELAISELPSEKENEHGEHYLRNLISDVLTKSALPQDLVAVVAQELPSSHGVRRSRLWQLTSACKSSSIADYAMVLIEQWGNDAGNACNYFIAHPEFANVYKERLIEHCERGIGDEQNWFTWWVWRAFALLGELGFTENAAAQLTAMMQRLSRIRLAVESDKTPSLSPGDAQVFEKIKSEHVRFRLDEYASLLVEAAAKARTLLSEDVLLSFLSFNIHNYSGATEHLCEALSGLDDDSIDKAITQTKEFWPMLSSLTAVCTRGATDTRIDLLAFALKQNYAHSAALNLVREAIEACWCDPICKMVMKTVSEIPEWSEHDSQFFWDFVHSVSMRLEAKDIEFIKAELSRAQTDFARRIMSIWLYGASGARIGLAKLS